MKKTMFSMRAHFILCFSIILLISSIAIPSATGSEPEIHKRYVYYIYWAGIRAGKAELFYDITPTDTTIKTHATSAKVISWFYKVDDWAVSTLYLDEYPKNYTLKIREGRHRRHKITDFGPFIAGKTQKIIFNNVLDEDTTEYEIDKQVYDPLSAFYAMTRRDLEIGKSEYMDIFDNKKLWNTEIEVLRKEKISVIAGDFETIVVKPLLPSEGIFLKKGEMHIWVTDDDRKIPVKFTSKAIIGHFSALLAEGEF